MPQNRAFSFGPAALTTTLTTNILNPNITSLAGPVGFSASQPYLIIKHIRIVNKTSSAAKVSLWKGATAGNVAGTEFVWNGKVVPANDAIDAYGYWRFDAADFLVGGSDTASALSISGEGEIGLS